MNYKTSIYSPVLFNVWLKVDPWELLLYKIDSAKEAHRIESLSQSTIHNSYRWTLRLSTLHINTYQKDCWCLKCARSQIYIYIHEENRYIRNGRRRKSNFQLPLNRRKAEHLTSWVCKRIMVEWFYAVCKNRLYCASDHFKANNLLHLIIILYLWHFYCKNVYLKVSY